MRWLAPLLLSLGLATSACETAIPTSATPLEYSQNAKAAYERALQLYFDKDWEHATEQFMDVKRTYGYSHYARLSELRLADILYRQKKFAEAVSSYKAFVHDYPNDPDVPYARYKVAKSLFDDASESLLLPPLEERDLASIEESRGTIKDFLAEYPTSRHSPELIYMQEVVNGLLARHELYVARFYLGRRNYQAAVDRIEHAMKVYPGSGLEPEALVLLGETLLRMKKADRAGQVLHQVLDQYPGSPFVVPAQNFLAQIQSKRE